MSKPFQITLIPGAADPKVKPGWHKRALAASRRFTPALAPQRGDSRADAKAVEYARWIAARDGVEVPVDNVEVRVDWQATQHGYRPRAVKWLPASRVYRPAARGMAQPPVVPLLRIELPHWDYEAPPVVESTLLEWSAPVVTEIAAAEPVAAPVPPVAARESAPLGNDDAPVPPMPGAPAPAVAAVTVDAAPSEPLVGIQAPHPVEAIGAACDHLEPMAICPAVGMPCKLDCGFRPGCVGQVADPLDAIEAQPLAALCSDDDAASVVGPVTVLCLSHRSREAILRRVKGRAAPTYGHAAKGGAFRLSLDDARACAGVKSVRFIGLPRKPYMRAAAPPVVGIQGRTPVRGILADVAPRSWVHPIVPGLSRAPVVMHSAPTL